MTNEVPNIEDVRHLLDRGKWLQEEIESIEKLCDKTVVSIITLCIIGIFFFPCLILAGLVFCLRCWGVNRIATYKAELDEVAQVPGVMENAKAYFNKS